MLLSLFKYISDQIQVKDQYFGLNDVMYMCRKDEEGRILFRDNFEYKFAGIDDRHGNYAYMRYIDDEVINYSLSTTRLTSCGQWYDGDIPIRLISVLTSMSVGQIETYRYEAEITKILLNINFSLYKGSEKKIKLIMTRSFLNPLQILKDENVKESYLDLNYIFLAHEFRLTYVTNIYECPKPFPQESVSPSTSPSVSPSVSPSISPSSSIPVPPIPMTNLVLWLNDTGSALDTWEDQSGLGNDAVQANPLFQPSIIPGALNGYPSRRFDGTNDIMWINNAITIGTAFVVSNWRGGGVVFPQYNGILSSGAAPWDVFIAKSGLTIIYPGVFVGNIYMDNVLTNDYSPFVDYKVTHGFTPGAPANFTNLIIGNGENVAGRYWNGDIIEIIAYSDVKGAPDITQIINYLFTKYALP